MHVACGERHRTDSTSLLDQAVDDFLRQAKHHLATYRGLDRVNAQARGCIAADEGAWLKNYRPRSLACGSKRRAYAGYAGAGDQYIKTVFNQIAGVWHISGSF